MSDKYRLITRADLDGIACAVLLKELGMVEDIKFAHPKDMQHGLIPVTDKDIIANLPYNAAAHLCFDHHASEGERNKEKPANLILDTAAPSAAQVIFRHYGGREKFPNVSQDMLDATDKIDSADVSQADILDPKGWVLLGFIMDNRTGLGRYKEFRINNFQLMYDLIEILRKNSDINDILRLQDVAERVRMYAEHSKLARHQIMKCAQVEKNLVILDYRHEKELYTTNRFTVYALFPKANMSMHILPGDEGRATVFAVGKSVLNRTSPLDVGALMLEYGGGGHKAVGTCQVEVAKSEQVRKELIEKITAAG
jgi:nanoRNase/pAp phosphatase (c-di-AMP/oligoRNAs hydrolase)